MGQLLKTLLQINSFRVNFGVTVFKHSKGLIYSQIQLDIHTDPTTAPQYLTNTLNLPQLSLQCHLAIHMNPCIGSHSHDCLLYSSQQAIWAIGVVAGIIGDNCPGMARTVPCPGNCF